MKISTLLPLALPLLITSSILAATQFNDEDYSQLSKAPVEPENVFFHDGTYFFVKPRIQVARGSIAAPSSSPDGRYLAYLIDPLANQDPSFPGSFDEPPVDPGPNRRLALYDFQTGSTREILNLSGHTTKVTYSKWIEDSPYVFIQFERDRLLQTAIINPLVPNSIKFLPPNMPDFASEEASDYSDDWFNKPIYIRKSDTLVLAGLKKEDSTKLTISSFDLQNGTTQIVEALGSVLRKFGDNVFVSHHYFFLADIPPGTINGILDLKTGKVTQADYESPEISPKIKASPLITTGGLIIFSDTEQESPYVSNSIEFQNPTNDAGASPNRQFAWNTDRAGLNIFPLQPMAEHIFINAFAPAVKAKAIQNAKQLGIGIAIYMADYDDHFPLANDVNLMLRPYVKNYSLFAGFTYLLNGEDSTKIENIQNVIVGNISTPFGAAIIRGDGSVFWQDKHKLIESNLKF